MKLIKKHIKLILAIALVCSIWGINNAMLVATSPLPQREIVYQLETNWGGGNKQKVGFINANGSGSKILIHNGVAILSPRWMDDGSLLLYVYPTNTVLGISRRGYGRSFDNLWAMDISIIHGRDEILITSFAENCERAPYPCIEIPVIQRVDINTGEVLQTYEQLFETDKEQSENDYINLGTNSFYKNELVYIHQNIDYTTNSFRQELLILNTSTSKIETLFFSQQSNSNPNEFIVSPAFSPDGEWIAYTRSDGIYLIRSDGSFDHKIVGGDSRSYSAYSPPSWSPDGTQLVYHRCIAYSYFACNEISNNSLFIYNVETQTERLLLDGGMNPYWRWAE